MKFSFIAIVILCVLGACVPNRKIQYLQHNDVNAKNLPTDSISRMYDVAGVPYLVQPEDLISVRIESLTPPEFDLLNRTTIGGGGGGAAGGQGNALLFGELVDAVGEIPFILSGKVKVSGLTLYQIQDKLQQIANESLKSPLVRVRLLNFRITVLGEVNKEGVVTMSNNRVSLIEALGLAGGMNEVAKRSEVKLIRQHSGKAQVYYINFLDENFFTSPLYYAQQGDILIVPPLRQRAYHKYFVQNLSVFISVLSLAFLVANLNKK